MAIFLAVAARSAKRLLHYTRSRTKGEDDDGETTTALLTTAIRDPWLRHSITVYRFGDPA